MAHAMRMTPPEDGRGEVVTLDPAASLVVRPQALLLTFCAHYLIDQPGALFTGTFVEALVRVGIGEHAARTTLTRMCKRGLLHRHRAGARVYLSLTARAEQMLRDAEVRIWHQGAVNRSWNGQWTLLSFSLPESRRADRHQLRKRLAWEGFRMLHSGLWITPSLVDVRKILPGLDVEREVKVFRASALAPTDVQEMVGSAWDLPALTARYQQFLARWDGPDARGEIEDPLARFLLVLTEWLLLVRIDPHLPVDLLPDDWPAIPAERLAIKLRQEYGTAARATFECFAERETFA